MASPRWSYPQQQQQQQQQPNLQNAWKSNQHRSTKPAETHSPQSPNAKTCYASPHRIVVPTKTTSTAISDQNNMPHHLRRQKQQWDAQRDIPTGTVRKFLPAPEPPSPQIAQQRKQWDTRTIPQGSVAQKAQHWQPAAPAGGTSELQSPMSRKSPSAYKTSNNKGPRFSSSPLSSGGITPGRSPSPHASYTKNNHRFSFDRNDLVTEARRNVLSGAPQLTPSSSKPSSHHPAVSDANHKKQQQTRPEDSATGGSKWNSSKEIPKRTVTSRQHPKEEVPQGESPVKASSYKKSWNPLQEIPTGRVQQNPFLQQRETTVGLSKSTSSGTKSYSSCVNDNHSSEKESLSRQQEDQEQQLPHDSTAWTASPRSSSPTSQGMMGGVPSSEPETMTVTATVGDTAPTPSPKSPVVDDDMEVDYIAEEEWDAPVALPTTPKKEKESETKPVQQDAADEERNVPVDLPSATTMKKTKQSEEKRNVPVTLPSATKKKKKQSETKPVQDEEGEEQIGWGISVPSEHPFSITTTGGSHPDRDMDTWGQAAVLAQSSDDWDSTPNWVKSESIDEDHSASQRAVVNAFGVMEEKKLEESPTSLTGRDYNILAKQNGRKQEASSDLWGDRQKTRNKHPPSDRDDWTGATVANQRSTKTASRNQVENKPSQDDAGWKEKLSNLPISKGTRTDDRDEDILQAAAQRKNQRNHTKISTAFDLFGDDTDADGFPSESSAAFAFPSSPFGGASHFDDFSQVFPMDNHSNQVDYDGVFNDPHDSKSSKQKGSKSSPFGEIEGSRMDPFSYPDPDIQHNHHRASFPSAQPTSTQNRATTATATPALAAVPVVETISSTESMEEQVGKQHPAKHEKKGFFTKLFGGGGGGNGGRKIMESKKNKNLRQSSKEKTPLNHRGSPVPAPKLSSKRMVIREAPTSVMSSQPPVISRSDRDKPRDEKPLNASTIASRTATVAATAPIPVPPPAFATSIKSTSLPQQNNASERFKVASLSHRTSGISYSESEDETTVSAMTEPSIFKDSAKAAAAAVAKQRAAPALKTVPSLEQIHESGEDVFHDPDLILPVGIISDSESEGEEEVRDRQHKEAPTTKTRPVDSVHRAQKASQPLPPPPPPPPAQPKQARTERRNKVTVESRTRVNHHDDHDNSSHDPERFNRRMHEKKQQQLTKKPSASPYRPKKAPIIFDPKQFANKPSFVARHAQTAYGKVPKKSIPTSPENKLLNLPKNSTTSLPTSYELKLKAGLNEFQEKNKTARSKEQKISQPMNTKSVAAPAAKSTTQMSGTASNPVVLDSVYSDKSFESSSVESDIRILRNILRRPRNGKDTEQTTTRSKPKYATYDDTANLDPMQRAGFRLLSAAIIPIQAEVRRFLAMRRALTRMWALIVIQAHTRRWLARKEYVKDLKSIVLAQAACRGHMQRNAIIYKHICAIEIQRHMRGYLSTMRVYEDIYRITMVQSFVRMKIAMEEASDRMALVIQLQAAARGFLVRRQREIEQHSAIAIQANWRCFVTRLTYQFDLLDIIIVQSVFRRKKAIRQTAQRRFAFHSRAATVIQTRWRTYDATLNYLHFLADVLIVQSTIRRFLVMRRVERFKNEAATKIQSVWRGFVCYADYMFSIADIVTVQKTFRRWRAMKETNQLRTVKRNKAAVTIQKRWRGYVGETEYLVMKYEFYAARTIQRYWRRFWCFSNFIIALDCSIQIQSLFRGYSQRLEIASMKDAATTIQCLARIYFAKKSAESAANSKRIRFEAAVRCKQEKNAALVIQTYFRATCARVVVRNALVSRRETNAALEIQNSFRGMKARALLRQYRAARTIQCLVRSNQARVAAGTNLAARIVQTNFRASQARGRYRSFVAGRHIQTAFRASRARRWYSTYIAARKIQTKFRASQARGRYRSFVAGRHIQTAFRASRARRWYSTYIAARKIQTKFRASQARGSYRTFIAARKIQTNFRGMQARVALTQYLAARKIQARFRANCVRVALLSYFAAISIQALYRGCRVRESYHAYRAARTIQSNFRGSRVRGSYHAYLAARTIQNGYRASRARALHKVLLANWIEQCAAVMIQSRFRGMQARTAVTAYFATRRIQSLVRGHQARTAVRFYKCARKIQSMWRCKRMYTAYKFYRAALNIQSSYRAMQARREVLVLRGEYLAATLIQSAWRGFVCYTDYVFTISDVIIVQKMTRKSLAQRKYSQEIKNRVVMRRQMTAAADAIQNASRGFLARRRYWYTLGCTMQIQSWVRGRLAVTKARKMQRAILKLQCFGRTCLARQDFLQRKFILALLRTADKEKTKRVAARVIQDKARNFLEERKRDQAARTIQRFFLQVKKEVDRLVQATKKRKSWRKKLKKSRNEKVEDALLEDAWESSIAASSTTSLASRRLATSVSRDETSGHNENAQWSIARLGSGPSSTLPKSNRGHDLKPRLPLKQQLPPKPSNYVRVQQDVDTDDDFSALTGTTGTLTRSVRSRMKRLGAREMDEDLELEEALKDTDFFSKRLNSAMVVGSSSRGNKNRNNKIPPVRTMQV